MTHSVIAPSDSGGWVKCPSRPFMRFYSRIPVGGKLDEAEEGTGAHEVAEKMVHGLPVNIGDETANGIIVDRDMITGAEIYAAQCHRLIKAYPEASWATEFRVHAHTIHEELFGTTDFYLYNPATDELFIKDYKYGFVQIDPKNNYPLLCYAKGVIDTLGLQEPKIHFQIVQPRGYHRHGPIRSWVAQSIDLRPKFNELANSAMAVFQPDPPAVAGKHCWKCPGMAMCEANRETAYAAIDQVSVAQPEQMTADQRAREIEILRHMKQMVDDRLEAQEAELMARIETGEHCQLLTVDKSAGRRVWRYDPALIIDSIKLANGVDVSKPIEALTPRQAIQKGAAEDVVKPFTHLKEGKKKLVSRDKTTANQAFGGSENGST